MLMLKQMAVFQKMPFRHCRREVDCRAFQGLGNAVRGMLRCLHDMDNANVAWLSSRLRIGLARLHFSVIHPEDDILAETLLGLEGSQYYGEQFNADYLKALDFLEAIIRLRRSPLADTLACVVRECDDRESLAILCHSCCREGFENLFEDMGEDLPVFVHSEAQYRKMPLTDVLIRVGPMRYEGIGRVPPGILTAPRFSRLEQIVWKGVRDDDLELVGLDAFGGWEEKEENAGCLRQLLPHGVRWQLEKVLEETKCDNAGVGTWPEIEVDETVPFELDVDRSALSEGGTIEAVAIHVSGGHVILLRKNSTVMTLVPGVELHACKCHAREVRDGDFLVLIDADTDDLVGMDVQGFPCAAKWKERLRERLQEDRNGFIEELVGRGISVTNPDTAVERWARIDEDRLNAPGGPRDRKILLEALGLESSLIDRAMREIAEYRGERISEGTVASALIHESVSVWLEDNLEKLGLWLNRMADVPRLRIPLPDDCGITGVLEIRRILAVEPESDESEQAVFPRVPERKLNIWLEPEEVDKWCVKARG